VCGFACDSPAARRRPTRETRRTAPECAPRAHRQAHAYGFRRRRLISRDISLRRTRFRLSKKRRPGRSRLARISAIGRAHPGRARGSITDRSHQSGAHRTHIMRGRCSMRDISVRKRGKRMPCARHIERDCIDRALRTALSANTCPAASERGGTHSAARKTSKPQWTRSHTADRLQLRRSDGR